MILQSLVQYYETLESQGKIAKPGWVSAKISYALCINKNGNLIEIVPLKEQDKKGKEIPRSMSVPEGTKRSVNIAPQFLWDNSKYLLGINLESIITEKDNETIKKSKLKKAKREQECFLAAKKLHLEFLDKAKGSYAQAIKGFFKNWNPQEALNNSIINKHLEDDVLSKANFVFILEKELSYAQDDSELKEIWDKTHTNTSGKKIGQCLVTGKVAPIALLHPGIRGIRGGQPAGCSLVSFNDNAYESYGHVKDQGLNAPVSEYATFAYTAALNYMVSSPTHSQLLGDTTIVFWEQDAVEAYGDVFNTAVTGTSGSIEQKDLLDIFEHISKNQTVDVKGITFRPDNEFYILGLTPNAARLSIRFFWHNTFGELIKNLKKYYEELQIIKPSFEKWETIPLWAILQETANKNSKDKMASPLLAGATLRAVLTGAPYPQLLYQNILLRVKADQDNPDKRIKKISWIKASIIKACLLRNYKLKEAVNVALDEKSNNVAYVLGRLFSVLEALQEKSNPDITSTIKDRYFNAACATPGTIFPILLKMANYYLRKSTIDKGSAIYFEKSIGELENMINMSTMPIPSRMNLEDQGIFILGYYHQTQKRYTKKGDK